MPHVHFHIMPRRFKCDYFSDNMDDIYPALERSEVSLPLHFKIANSVDGRSQPLKVDADENRIPRSLQEMEKEADWLRTLSVNPQHDSSTHE